ncbi:LuxR family transcriptional regulator [Nocardioides guangzhouensis]|uniref:LuxR family transcriptional regulator n=1 Tax=Nocardioides guangzhouensis TaxID=2497878 RepID=A0A4Q4ZHS6_9ACTN|nr:LuxR family transcriptional regulator [Nocardioides guangzhouensis]RYP87753.1 LuxR family transcriptional regulator [Nocardioides guangzhouensis]
MPQETGVSGSTATRLDPHPPQQPAPVGERRLSVPQSRSGIVERCDLVAALLASTATVITAVAPPGYGKTTMLAQWAERLGDRACWVTCEDADNDPTTLWAAIVAALQRLAPPGWAGPELLAHTGVDLAAVPALVAAVSAIRGRVVLVLDQLEAVRSRESWAALAEFALRLPPGWQVAFGSREPLPLPVSRLRMQETVLEIGVDRLAMTSAEARELFAGAGLALTDAEADDLARRTEGWPAGLYLASLAMRAGVPAADLMVAGGDRLMRDYLRSELLDRVAASDREFLVQTSILDQLSGPLCDAVVGRTGSTRVLEQLEARNLLVVPLDRRGEWYRYHHLLRDLLQSELRNLDPDSVREAHLRAAAWHTANGRVGSAIRHAQLAEDADQVAGIVLTEMQPLWVSGRVETVRAWMDWLSRHPTSRYYTAIAAHAALIFALLGRSGDAERWGAAADTRLTDTVLPDGSTEAGTRAYLHAILARSGPAATRRDAFAALDGLSPVSPYRPTMHHTIALSYLLEGDLDRAEAGFAEAHDLAVAAGARPLVAMVLAERHLVARARGDLLAADQHLEAAVKIVESERLESFWTSALVLAAAARSSAARGEMPAARSHVRQAAHLRPLLTHMLPVVSVQALLELTQAYVDLVDPAGARAALQQAGEILLRRPGVGSLAADAQRLGARLGQITKSPPVGASSLTAAELRLLPLLPTHLSFPQMADQLALSRNTVKTQVASLYRKFGVSSRREAVERITQIGFSV